MRIAIAQDGPIYLDAAKTLEKTKVLLEEAADEKADLIVFGENWFSGYPVWIDVCKDVSLWDHEPIKKVWAQTFSNGISLGDPIMNQLSKAIQKAGIHVVMGANEAVSSGSNNGTIFNSIFTFNGEGDIVNHHRKLVPTFTEKLVHGHGDGKGLQSVDTDFGRLGSLICWEHWMPLTRQAMHDAGEDIHIALWPYAKEMHQVASRHYAHEGRCFVVAVGQVMHKDELPAELEISESISLPVSQLLLRGGSSIYGPDGSIVLDPVYDNRGLFIRDIDISKALPERMNLAVSGHYQRHDVFSFDVKRDRK